MEADTVVLIVTIVGSVLGSTLTTIGLLLKQIDRLDDKFDDKFDTMGHGVSDIRESLARVEGFLMAPEGFVRRRRRQPAPPDPPAEDPNPSATSHALLPRSSAMRGCRRCGLVLHLSHKCLRR